MRGLSESLLRSVDAVLNIPMRGKKESLNVSVAFGIVVEAVPVSVIREKTISHPERNCH